MNTYKTFYKKLLISFAVLLIFSCTQKAQKTEISTNPNFDVELLFEKDGCKVYRFYDGRYVYFTNCNGNIQYSTGGKAPQDISNEISVKN